MSTAHQRTIVVCGGTGRQGGAVVRHLTAGGYEEPWRERIAA